MCDLIVITGRRYREMEKETKPKIPSSHCSAEEEERQVTVSLKNPHTPVRHVIAFLRCFCSVVRNPRKNLDENGFWNSSWSVTVRLKKDPSTSDGLQHLPQRCTLGNSEALITYSDMPQMKSNMEEASQTESPSSPCSNKSEEREVTVSVQISYTPAKEVAAFLGRFCTVVKGPTKILDGLGFWTFKWSVTVKLWKDPFTSDGLQHLPQRCTLGNSEALITYSDIPQICKGNPGQKLKDSPKKATYKLQDQENHVDQECPKKSKMLLKRPQDKTTVLSSIPVEMRDELLAGVEYIKTLANRFQNLDPVMVDLFGEKLAERLCQKYTGHWYPEKPMKGQAYRCIRINRHDRDESILEACAHSGLKYHELTLPQEMTLWIDPYEVSCRLGEESYPYTVATFDPRTPRLPDPPSRVPNSSYADCSTPTPEEDSSIGSSSLPSSPSLNGEDSDSGIDVNCDRTTTPPMSCSPTEENIWRNPAVNQDSPAAIFRTSSPLWIPAWRAPQFYHSLSTDPQQVHWL